MKIVKTTVRYAKYSILLFLFTFILLESFPVHAQNDIPPTKTDTKNVQATKIDGEVLKVQGKTITINTNNGVKKITVPEGIKITKNSGQATANEINPRDMVTVTTNNGEVLSIDATSGQLIDTGKMLIPIVIGAILLLGLLYYLWRKSQQGHIKTDVKNIK